MSESEQEEMADSKSPSPKTAFPSSSASARSSTGRRRSPTASSRSTLLEQALRRAEAGLRRKTAGRAQLARRRQLPELALSRSGEAAGASGSALARRIAITARSAARARSAICTRRHSASRAANARWRPSAARKRSRPRPRPSAPRSSSPWTPFAHDVEEPKRGAAFQKPLAVKLGVFRPITVYPFYESATSAHWGQTPREALAESGTLWSTLCRASPSENPNSWLKKRFTSRRHHDADAGEPADRLALHQADGRQPQVNMGGAVLLTASRRRARPASPRTSWSTRSAAPRPKSRATICSATSSTKAIRRTRC